MTTAKDLLTLVRKAHGGRLPPATRVTLLCERADRVGVECPVHAEACLLGRRDEDTDERRGERRP